MINAPTIDVERMLAELRALLGILSPSGHTDEIVHYVCERLTRLGIEHEVTRRGAIRANLPGRRSSPDRAIVAHLDTLGAIVNRIKEDGRLGLAQVGTWSARFAEGARGVVLAPERRVRGTILPLLASGHSYGDAIDTQPISWDNVELRLDELVATPEDVRALGIDIGDLVAIDPQPEFLDAGFIVSRHLDNKAGVAALLAAAEAIVEKGAALPVDCHLLFTIHEEVGSGASAVLHQDVAEMVSVDCSTPSRVQNSTEFAATIAMADSTGPFDRHLSRLLIDLAAEHNIPICRDVFRYYRCDAASAVEAGNDIRTALIGFGVDSSHGYERTHVESLRNVGQLVVAYALSEPAVPRDEMTIGPIAGFPVEEP